MDRQDARPMLPEIRVPVLICQGGDDSIVPLEEAQAMGDLIPGSRLEIVPDAGHLLTMEQPENYNQIVLQFIQAVQRGDV